MRDLKESNGRATLQLISATMPCSYPRAAHTLLGLENVAYIHNRLCHKLADREKWGCEALEFPFRDNGQPSRLVQHKFPFFVCSICLNSEKSGSNVCDVRRSSRIRFLSRFPAVDGMSGIRLLYRLEYKACLVKDPFDLLIFFINVQRG